MVEGRNRGCKGVKATMPNNDGSTLPEYIGAFFLGLLTFALSYLFPDMTNDGLRLAIAGALAIVGWGVCHYVIKQRFKRFAHWLGRIWTTLWSRVKAMFESVNAKAKRFRACLRGALEQCRSELETEKEKYQEERGKVDELTIALATLSQHVLGLFDKEMEKTDELEWSDVLTASERAIRCAKSALHHHVTKIVYYDPTYPAAWMKGETAEKTRNYFVESWWFVEKNAQQLRDWIVEILNKKDAHKSLVVFAQDIVPETVAEVPNDTCLLRKYLDAGGRIVWRGDIPFFYQGKPGEAREEWRETGAKDILGVNYYNYCFRWGAPRGEKDRLWDSNLPLEITPLGQDIGLTIPSNNIRIRPVPSQDVDTTYVLIRQEGFTIMDVNWQGSDDDDFAVCWKKCFCKRYPHSGFMQYIPGEFLWRDDDTTASFFNFAVSGWPLFF